MVRIKDPVCNELVHCHAQKILKGFSFFCHPCQNYFPDIKHIYNNYNLKVCIHILKSSMHRPHNIESQEIIYKQIFQDKLVTKNILLKIYEYDFSIVTY